MHVCEHAPGVSHSFMSRIERKKKGIFYLTFINLVILKATQKPLHQLKSKTSYVPDALRNTAFNVVKLTLDQLIDLLLSSLSKSALNLQFNRLILNYALCSQETALFLQCETL